MKDNFFSRNPRWWLIPALVILAAFSVWLMGRNDTKLEKGEFPSLPDSIFRIDDTTLAYRNDIIMFNSPIDTSLVGEHNWQLQIADSIGVVVILEKDFKEDSSINTLTIVDSLRAIKEMIRQIQEQMIEYGRLRDKYDSACENNYVKGVNYAHHYKL